MESSQDPSAAMAAMGPMFAVIIVFYLVLFIASIVAHVSIIRKAGYSGWWILSILFPPLALVMFFIFAFSKWPVQKKAEGTA